MDETIARLNIAHFEWLLGQQDLDDAKRRTVLRLLSEERAKLEKILQRNTKAQREEPSGSR